MELLTPEQAAQLLQLSPWTIRRLLREGVLPGVKIGKRQWRISKDALEAYVNGQQPRPSK